jgi:hypothetical protein
LDGLFFILNNAVLITNLQEIGAKKFSLSKLFSWDVSRLKHQNWKVMGLLLGMPHNEKWALWNICNSTVGIAL